MGRHQRNAPKHQRDAQPAFSERQRKHAERVIEKMRADISEKHQPR
jgi:hypothetical protein